MRFLSYFFQKKKPKKPIIHQPNTLPKKCPTAILRLIADNIYHAKDLTHLARVSRGFYHPVAPVLIERKLAHLVIGDPTPANKAILLEMLDTQPELLNLRIKHSHDQSGRIIKNRTVFQLALGAGDRDYHLAMKPAFLKLSQGDEKAAMNEIKKQSQAMLDPPDEAKIKESASKLALTNMLEPVIAAITVEPFNKGADPNNRSSLSPHTLAVIAQFRKEYAKMQSLTTHGMHFRYNTLSEVYEAYGLAAAKWWRYHQKKCALFEDAVLSTVLSDLPVNDAQHLSQGLDHDEARTPRSLNLRKGAENYYKVLRGPSMDFVLEGRCVDISIGAANRTNDRFALMGLTVNAYVRDKNESIRIDFEHTLTPPQTKSPKSH